MDQFLRIVASAKLVLITEFARFFFLICKEIDIDISVFTELYKPQENKSTLYLHI